MKRIYIIGPMSGMQSFNYPAFHVAEMKIVAAGHAPLSPARHGIPTHYPRPVFIRHGIHLLLQADAVHLLRGWEESKGARLEVEIATELGLGDWRKKSVQDE